MATGADWRVGDAEREAVAEQLREHYAAGRLTIDEFRARLDAAYSATTAAGLSRVTADLLKELLPSSNFEYFLCGNGAFMKSITDGLEDWGVPDKDVHFEAFGPATVKKKTAPSSGNTTILTKPIKITFGKSGKECAWDPMQTNLLDFARDQGIKIDSGCCAGSCGSCVVAIKSGSIEYVKPPDAPPEDGCCLTCICKPKGDLILDA